MDIIHTIFTPEQIPLSERFMKNLTMFSVEGAPLIQKEKYSGLYPVDLTGDFMNFKINTEKLLKLNKKTVVILPPFPKVAEFYLHFSEYVILRFEGKRKFYRDNYPDMTLTELEYFDECFCGEKKRVLIEFSGVCKDCNINSGTYKYITLSQSNLKMYIKNSTTFISDMFCHNYYTYTDNMNTLHIVWLEDNYSISTYYNFLKEKNYGGVSWKNPTNAADGNWEAMYSVKVKL